MASSRSIQISYWTDSKIIEFSLECRYMYLYLLTNPNTNNCGCYVITYSQIHNETGFDIDKVQQLVNELENTHRVIKYDEDTKEMLIVRWHLYNWTKSKQYLKGVRREIDKLKCLEFKNKLTDMVNTLIELENIEIEEDKPTVASEVITYLNTKCNTKHSCKTKLNVKLINSLIKLGYTVDDMKKVIDKKYVDWVGTKYEVYLRPSTLFGDKFATYLTQEPYKKKNTTKKTPFHNFEHRDYDMAELERKYVSNGNEL